VGRKHIVLPHAKPTDSALIFQYFTDGLEQGFLSTPSVVAVSRITVFNLFRAIARAAGLPENLCHPHVLKHTAAMLMVRAGANAFLIRQRLGHRRLIRRYANPSASLSSYKVPVLLHPAIASPCESVAGTAIDTPSATSFVAFSDYGYLGVGAYFRLVGLELGFSGMAPPRMAAAASAAAVAPTLRTPWQWRPSAPVCVRVTASYGVVPRAFALDSAGP